jgi:hypothetical protein
MEDHIPLSGPIDLNALDGYLMSDHAPDDSMGLSDLDGFLTGIAYSARSWAATELALGRHNYPYQDICGLSADRCQSSPVLQWWYCDVHYDLLSG